MRVEGIEIPQAVVDDVLHKMQESMPFTFHYVNRWFQDAGVIPSYRAADRLLQRERRAGHISWDADRHIWSWVR